MLEHLTETLDGDLGGWSGLAYRHISPTFDPLSTRGAELHGGRWNASGTSALYLATSATTARAEFDRLVELRAQSGVDLLPRTLATVRLDLSRVVDVRSEPILRELGVTDGRYEQLLPSVCVPAGELAQAAGVAGLVAPSVTGKGLILVAFPQNFADSDEIDLVDQVDVDWT